MESPLPAPAPQPDLPVSPAEPTESADPCFTWRHDPTFRLGQDYAIGRGEAVDNTVAVFGNVTVDGHVCGDLSVTLGDVRLGREATIHGTLVVVGGRLTIEPGAAVNQELVLVGGRLDAPADFRAGRGHIIVGVPVIGDRLRTAVPYLTRGLLLGRLVVPDLPWVWVIVATVLFVYVLLTLLFPQPTWAAANVIAERPLSTFAAGLLVLVLTVPIAALLAVTVIGLAALPVLFGGLFIAWIVGKIAACRWIGTRVLAQDEPDNRLQSVRSLVIGFVLITIAYMIPVLGIIVWGLTGVLGLGAASLTFIRAFRRENPPPPPRPGREMPMPVAPAAPAVPYVPASHTAPQSGATVGADADLTLNRSAATDTFTMPPPAFAGDVPPMPAAVAAAATAAATDPRTLLAFPHAAFGERAAAFALDVVLIALSGAMIDVRDPAAFTLWGLVAYHVAFWTWKATTLGGIICQLRVVRVDGAPLRFVDTLVRGLTGIFSLAAFGIGALWILRDPERQAWHDKVAGTFVVKVPRHYPLP